MIVTGAALVTFTFETVVPDIALTVQVPPVTDKVTVGFAPVIPSRVIVTVVEVTVP